MNKGFRFSLWFESKQTSEVSKTSEVFAMASDSRQAGASLRFR